MVPRCFRWVRTVERNPKGCQTVAGGRVCETPGDSVNSSSTLEGCQKSGRSNRNAPVWHPYGVLSLAGRSGGLADSTSGYALSTLRVESIHRMPTENSEEPRMVFQVLDTTTVRKATNPAPSFFTFGYFHKLAQAPARFPVSISIHGTRAAVLVHQRHSSNTRPVAILFLLFQAHDLRGAQSSVMATWLGATRTAPPAGFSKSNSMVLPAAAPLPSNGTT